MLKNRSNSEFQNLNIKLKGKIPSLNDIFGLEKICYEKIVKNH